MKTAMLIIGLILIGCNAPEKSYVEKVEKITTEKVPEKDSVFDKSKCDDPIFFMQSGTSFPIYFQALYRLGKFEQMIKWTSAQNLKMYGRERLMHYYQRELVLEFELGKLTSLDNKVNKEYLMTYSNAKIYNTRTVIRFKIVVERDSCRILLESIKPMPF